MTAIHVAHIVDTGSAATWIFAYGSLIFRPSFAYAERRRAFITGYLRRFWQGSPDHRGVPEAPGRVVTLVAATEQWSVCGGCAYRIEGDAGAILDALDAREQAGFERRLVPLLPDLRGEPFAEGTVWIAGPANAHFLGPADDDAIALQIANSRGPSGPNAEYVILLRDALEALDVHDPHVEAIAAALEAQRAR